MSDQRICTECGLEIPADEHGFCGAHADRRRCFKAGEKIRAELAEWKCDSHRPINVNGCVSCGDRVCCPACCRIVHLKAELKQAEEERDGIGKAYRALKEGK